MCSLFTEQSKTLFVRGLSEDTTEETLRESFEGSISARIVTDRDTGSSKGWVKYHLGWVQVLQSTSLNLISAIQGVYHAHVGGSVKLVNGVGAGNAQLWVHWWRAACAHFSPLLNELLPANKSPWQLMDSHEKKINCTVLANSQWGSIDCD